MKVLRLLNVIILLLILSVSVYGYIWEGFERENLWLITPQYKNAVNSIKIVDFQDPEYRNTEGEKSLRISLKKTSWSVKGMISREGLFDLSGITEIQLDIYVQKSVIMSIGFSTGSDYEWFESSFFKLKRGWNTNLILSLTKSNWKCRASKWENAVQPENLDDTRKITFVFAKGHKGKVFIDNIQFFGKEIVNDAYAMIYEPIETVKITNFYNQLKGLMRVSFAKDYSDKIIKEKNNLYTLPFIDVNNSSKAAYKIDKGWDWSTTSKILMKVKNNSKNFCCMCLGFQVGGGWVWYETPQYLLKPRRSTEFVINLNAPYFKSEATDWKYNTYLFNKDNIKAINFLIYGVYGKTSSGNVTIEEFQLMKGKEFLAQRKIIPPLYLEKVNKELYKKPKIIKMSEFSSQVSKYDKFELTFYLTNHYQNPYNPEEIFCEGIFTGPDGKIYKVPGFYYEDQEKLETSKEIKQIWKIRFAPFKEGKWKFKLKVKNLQGETVYRKKELQFKCTSSGNKGFIRIKNNEFTFEDGTLYYPFGLSLGWVVSQDKNGHLGYLDKFSQAGMNWIRVWNVPWDLKLEWSTPKRKGIGRYYQKDASKWDEIIEYAKEKNIYILFCINNYKDFTKGHNWEQNPYSYYNGGPLQEPEAFFTEDVAKKFFKRKLLYIIARWGYATSINSWEFFNEVDLSTKYNEDDVAEWHEEMGAYVKSIDPFKHLITTSFSRRLAGDETFELSEIDYSQTHVYTEDFHQALFSFPQLKMKKYDKLHVIGEIGGSVEQGSAEAKDKSGIRIHNVLWYAFFSGAPSSALYWWWDEYIEENNLYYHFKNLSDFTIDVDYRDRERIALDILTTNTGDYFFAPIVDWEGPTGEKYKLVNNEMIGDGLLSQYLQGEAHKKWRVEPEFEINFLKDGKFLINVDVASYAGSGFNIFIDDKKVLTETFPVIDSTLGYYVDKVFKVNVPKGKHTIRIENNFFDWIKIKWFKFTDCVPDVEAHGLRSNDKIYIWVKNRDFDIDNVLNEKKVKLSGTGIIELKNIFKTDIYNASYYDTWTGGLIKTEVINAEENKVSIKYPEIEKDILIILEKGEL